MQPDLPPPKGFALAGRYGDFRLFEDPNVLPRVFFVPAAKVVENRDERLRILTSPGFDHAKLVLLEEPAPALQHQAPPDAKADVKVLETRPGYYRVQVNAPGDGFLVLAENHYPGWTATVTPHPASAARSPAPTAWGSAPPLRADHFLQAVRLDQGACQVEFAYRSAPLHRGLLLAALAAGLLALPAAALLLGALRPRRQGPSSSPADCSAKP